MKAIITTAIVSLAAIAGSANADVSTRYKFVAADQAQESNVCVVAAQNGYQAAQNVASKAGLEVDNLFCNGRNVERFARKYSRVSKVATANASL